jgi:hypothetical protein
MSSGPDTQATSPSAAADAVTPPTGGGSSPGTRFLHRTTTIFEQTQLERIVELCFGSDQVPHMLDWIEQLDDLLGAKLGAVRPTDLTVLDTDMILSQLDPLVHTKFVSPVRSIRLRVILDYLLLVKPHITDTVTYDVLSTMVKGVTVTKLPPGMPPDQDTTALLPPPVVTPPKKTPDGNGTLFDKLDLPKLTKFTGDRGEWFKWSESVRVAFGSVGASGSLTDQDFHAQYPKVSERVFYVLYAALQAGTCGGLARQFEMASDLNAFLLWTRITQEYETDTNKLNQSLYMVQRLLGIKLTKDIPVSQFRDNFRTQWLEYRKINPIMANEKDFLRPLMLMSLQDDSYDKVREKILADPSLTVDDFLEELRNREQILQGINGDDMNNIDGTAADSIRGRRTNTEKSNKKAPIRNGGGTSDSTLSGPWNIPLIPKSWMGMLGKGIFQTLLQWRTAAHGKNITVDQLRKQFEVIKYDTGGDPGQGKKRKDSAPSTQSPSTDDTKSPPPKKVRFALRESRRIVTERADPSSSA